MSTKFLNQAYGISTLDSRALYTAWSDSYDQEVHENGYVTPLRVAEALDRHVLDKTQRCWIMDAARDCRDRHY